MIDKIKNNKFISSTLILLIGGFISKFLGFVLKIIITRQIGVKGMGIYSMLIPTISLFNTLAILSYPTAISSLIASKNKSTKSLMLSIIPVSIIINLALIFIIIILAPYLSNIFLKEPNFYYPIISIGLTLPFIGLSSIVKSYYWGHQNMGPYILSNIVEQLVRMALLIVFVPKLINVSLYLTISIIILVNIISETSSIIVMVLFLPKKIKIKKDDLKINKQDVKDIMNISIPITSGKLIGTLFYSLEPIIITNLFLYLGYTKDFILNEYGILNGYSLSLLLLPSFFTSSISTSLIPELSKHYALNDYKMCIKRIKQIILISISIGLISTLIIYLFPSLFLNLLFHKTLGINYIKILGPFIILYFIEVPLSSSLQAMNQSKKVMKITLISEIVRLISLVVLSLFKIGMYSLVIAIIINMITSTLLYFINVKKCFK